MGKAAKSALSRRDFVKVSATAAAVLAVTGCTPENKVTETEPGEKKVYRLDPELDPETGGKWVPVACWHNCGGKCANYAYVVDNVVLRQKTDDTHEDSPNYPQQRSCLRGRSQQQQCFGADRLKYPMKRTHWEPGGGDKSLRGKDTWERISWEEALDYVANELKTAKEKYGNKSILYASTPAWARPIYGDAFRLLGLFGGYTGVSSTTSYGGFSYNIKVMGLPTLVTNTANDRLSLKKCENIVLYACNPAWASGGNPSYHLLQAKEAGAQFVFVGPEYNITAAMLEARWISVRPGSDTAFLLSVAYEMIRAENDAPGTIIDQEFLDAFTLGFDAGHMPEDATINENLKDYLLGAYDGIPKTAKWASEICGTPIEDIIWYANLMSKNNKVALLHAYAAARCNNAEDFPQIFYAVGAMGGHFSGEGHACGLCYHTSAGNCGAPIVNMAMPGHPTIPNVEGADYPRDPELWQAILDKKYNYTGDYFQGGGTDAPSEIRELDIHLIYHEGHSYLQTLLGTQKGIEAHRQMDFVVTQDFVPNTNAMYSDIVLPVTTSWEREDGLRYAVAANREMKFFPQKVTEPLYETKDDAWIIRELAVRLDIEPDQVMLGSTAQTKFNAMAGATLTDPEGNSTPLVTITQQDLTNLNVTGEEQEGVISIPELCEKGLYQVPRSENDGYEFNGWDAYIKDPVGHPFPSKSGKFEIYCEEKANIVNAMKRSTVKPYPTYIRPLNGYEDSFSDWENKVKGEYPFQITNPHYLRTAQAVFNNVPWIREALWSPVWINAADAASKGITQGDTILIHNQYGRVLRIASLSERVMPGVVMLPHGGWAEFDGETGVDKGGAANNLCAPVSRGVGISGFNTNLVNYEKYDGEALEPDYKWPQRIIEL